MPPLEDFLGAIDLSGDAREAAIRSSMERLRSDIPTGLADIVKSARAGDIDLDTAQQRCWDLFADGHSRATYLGRNLAGNDLPFGVFDTEYGKLASDGQAPHFERFLSDALSGKYDDAETGELNTAAIEARADKYNHALRGTGNEASTNSLPADELIIWELGIEDAGTCTMCPSLADDGPYKPSEMPTWPGSGETPCVFNCRCTIRTESGQSGF